MSHIPPPYGPPYSRPPQPPAPPYNPPPGAYTYMPAPVVMPGYTYPPQPPLQPSPAPEPAPTYVTNYIYHQSEPPTPEPVNVVQGSTFTKAPELIEWVPTNPTSAAALAHRAFVAGKEGWDSSPLWAIRAHHSGDLVPGKLAVKHRSAFIPHAGKEIPVHNFEVLCAPEHALRWLPASNGEIPVGAIPAGNTHNAEPLYIGRVRHFRSVTPGKVHASHRCCYISFGGKEIEYRNYEVLCKIVG